jgi:hypothetical protein
MPRGAAEGALGVGLVLGANPPVGALHRSRRLRAAVEMVPGGCHPQTFGSFLGENRIGGRLRRVSFLAFETK